MQPSEKGRGVIFSPEELPAYLSILEDVVRYNNRNGVETQDGDICSMVLSGIKQSRSFRRGQPAFVPARAAIAMSNHLERLAGEGTAGVVFNSWFAMPVPSETACAEDLRKARSLEDAVIESHRLNR